MRTRKPRSAASSPRPRARGNPLCVCVRHTARRTLRGVQLARQGLGAGCGREGSPHALRGRSLPPPHPRVCACVRRAGGGRAPWSQERCASSQRNRKFADGGLPADKKIEQLEETMLTLYETAARDDLNTLAVAQKIALQKLADASGHPELQPARGAEARAAAHRAVHGAAPAGEHLSVTCSVWIKRGMHVSRAKPCRAFRALSPPTGIQAAPPPRQSQLPRRLYVLGSNLSARIPGRILY